MGLVGMVRLQETAATCLRGRSLHEEIENRVAATRQKEKGVTPCWHHPLN